MIKSTQSNRPSHWATPWSKGSLGGEGLLAPLLNVLGWFCFQSHVYEILYISFPTISCPFKQCSMLLFQAIFHSFKFLFSICRKLDNKALFGIISVFNVSFNRQSNSWCSRCLVLAQDSESEVDESPP